MPKHVFEALSENKRKVLNQFEKTRKFLAIGSICFLLGSGFCFDGKNVLAADSKDDEEKVEDLQEKIEELENEIDQKRSTERTIADEIEIIDKNVAAIQLEMEKTKQTVNQLDQEILAKDLEIEKKEIELLQKKQQLAEYLRRMSQSGQEQEMIFLENGGSWEEYFKLVDSYERMQDDVAKALAAVDQVKVDLENQRAEIDDKRGQQQQVYLMKEDQSSTMEYEQNRKGRLLQQTQKDISSLSVEKDDLRAQLNALQSLGNPINLEEAIEIAKYAAGKTGVRTAFLLGVLRVESNLGQNVGGGRYKSDMNPSQHSIFKTICKDLKLDASDMPVSRRVCYNTKSKDGCGGWGGAMGPAQFMPSTWVAYQDRVEKVTGHNPPNPWNLKDALVAMGLKLSAVSGVTSHKESAERKAAAMYLAGGAWQNYSWYGDRVLYYADGFERYMKD